jgi:arylsulfatase A-like enzyme
MLRALFTTLVIAMSVGMLAMAPWFFRPRHENVILITIDTMRPDRISAYGYTKHTTPNLDRLAREGTLFENTFCDVTWTTPSMASVMTGTYATRHGLRSSHQKLASSAVTLAEILNSRGMDTAAIIASYPLHSIFGLNQGFALYDEHFNTPLALDEAIEFGPPPPRTPSKVPPSDDTKAMGWFLMDMALSEAYRSDAHVSDRAITWLRQERRDPFFLWIHYFGPHEKPTGYVGLGNIEKEQSLQLAAYDPDVIEVDAEIGRVLATLDQLDLSRQTAVILHADHGQSLMEHGYFGHGRNIFDPTARIPLIIRAPDRVAPGVRDTTLARNVDILPTVLALIGSPNPVAGDGTNLFEPRPDRADAETYLETYLSATKLFSDLVDARSDLRLGFRRLGLRTSRWKLVINDPVPFVDTAPEPLDEALRRRHYSEQLYDLTADPGETVNVADANTATADALRGRVHDQQTRGSTQSAPMPMNATTRERLKALGYVGE